MITVNDSQFRTDLVDRRQHLVRAHRQTPRREIHDLLAEVDAALERLDHGTFGFCDVCHDHVETDRLLRDPLSLSCSDHPSPSEQARTQRDLALARDVQRGLLPKSDLAIDGWQYRYRYEAAREVGGDFLDVIPIAARSETLILVGDVSGKGVAASMMMSSLLATFRSLSSLGLPTSELLARVNDLFHDSASPSSYATLAAAALLPGGRLDLYSAGHWPPILRRGKSTEPVEVEAGLPLGLFAASHFAPTRVALNQGDTLLFYTDGAIDAENGDGEDYSTRRLVRALAAADGNSPEALDTLVDDCLHDVHGFQGGRRLDDDLTLVAVRRAGGVDPEVMGEWGDG